MQNRKMPSVLSWIGMSLPAVMLLVSLGIVEKFLFRGFREEASTPPWSENYKRYDAAARASSSVILLLEKFGARDLTTREELFRERAVAVFYSNLALFNARAISRTFFADINPELPDAYLDHYVAAMDAWSRGFAEGDITLVQEGISDYNAFVLWTWSSKYDFKPMH